MSQEDDLRGLARVMDFMRALSILFVIINIYWYCYPAIKEWGINIGVVDKILLNFHRTAGLFTWSLYTKLFCVVFLALSCIGTKGVKEEKIKWVHIGAVLSVGFVLFFFNWWLLDMPVSFVVRTAFYILTLTVGYLCLLAAGIWISRLLKNNLLDDVFNDKNVQRELMGDFDNVIFNFDMDESKYGGRIPHQLSISREVSFTFIKALRDVVSDFQDNRKNPLLTLLKNKSEDIKEEDFKPISIKVDDLNKSIEELDDIQMITNNISETIKEAVGTTYSPSSLSIKSNLPSEAEKLLQSLKLFIGEPEEDYEGGIHELSLGGANLIFLTLKLLEYKYRKEKDKIANFLLIEEPEAHIHTHIQKALFDKLNYTDTQIIYSTHSTHISEVSNISSMNILGKYRNYSEVYQPFIGLGEEEIMKVQRFLDAIRSNLLFAKSVILVEGDAEEILIPIMVKQTLGVSLDELGISLINVRSTGFENLAQLFHNHRIKKRCAIITDLDVSITGEKTEASKRGKTRKENLDALKKKNKWIGAFYAPHTFEIDFLEAGNKKAVLSTIKKVYIDEQAIQKSKEEIESEDIKKYGKRILTMANKMGKGWYAILLGKYITSSTHIPNYILDAIIFAKPEFSKELLLQIFTYVLSTYKQSEEIDKLKNDLLTYKKDEITLGELKECLGKGIQKTEPILYILNRL